MSDFVEGFVDELEKIAERDPYSIHYRKPEEGEVEEIKRKELARQLVASGLLTAGGALTGAAHGGKGALIGAGLGAGTGLGLTGLMQALPRKMIYELEDPTGSYGSWWQRQAIPLQPDVIRSEGGKPEAVGW